MRGTFFSIFGIPPKLDLMVSTSNPKHYCCTFEQARRSNVYPIKHIVIHIASSCSCCRIVGAAESRSRIGQQDRTKVAEQASSGSYFCSFSPRPSFVSYGFSHIYLCLLAVYVLSRVLINISIRASSYYFVPFVATLCCL